MNKRSLLLACGLIVLHAALACAAILIFDLRIIYKSDPGIYIERAQQFSRFYFTDFQTNWNYAPGYSVFLALTGWLTSYNHYAITLVQAAVFGGAFIRLANALVRAGHVSQEQALGGLAVVLLNPGQCFGAAAVLSETLCAALLALSAATFVRCLNAEGSRAYLWLGFWNGLLVITRFEYLVAPLLQLSVLFVWKGRGAALRNAPQVLAFALLLLSLNGLRNYYVFDRFNPFSFGSGTVIYGGNNLLGDGSWHSERHYQTYIPQKHRESFVAAWKLSQTKPLGYLRKDSVYKAMALDAWRIDPALQLRAIPLKLGKTWLVPPSLDPYTPDAQYRRSLQIGHLIDRSAFGTAGAAKHLAFLLAHWALLALGLSGAWLLWRNGPARAYVAYVALLTLTIAALFATVFYGLPRFAAVVEPLLFFKAGMWTSVMMKRLQKSTDTAPQE